MLIPLYVLIGVWGGAGRLGATIKFVVYTVAGSLLMLAAIVVFGLQQGTFDLTKMGTSSNDWLFLGFAIAFAVKAPIWPFHGWLPDAYREAPAEVSGLLSGVISKVAAYGFLRIAIAKFPGPTHDFRVPILVLASIGLVYGSLLAFRAPDIRGVIAYSSLAQMGLITFGLFAANDLGFDGAVLQMVNHGLISMTLFLLAGMVERRAPRRDGTREAGARDGAADDGRDRPRRAALRELRRRVPDPGRRLPAGLGLGRDRGGRDRAGCDVHAEADLGRAARAGRPGGVRSRPRPPRRRAGGGRPARRAPPRPLGLAGGDQRAFVRQR
jgi:hypothetical protein